VEKELLGQTEQDSTVWRSQARTLRGEHRNSVRHAD